jgi:DNA-binding transcriptional LysR family regulator
VECKQSPFDFRHLQTFCRVADLKNFSKAADDLFLTQPTVSGHILSLEGSLGVRLFDRTGREARLTRAGQIFYDHATRLLGFRQDALNALSAFSQGIKGELVLGASTIPGEYILPGLLAAFRSDFPQVTIALKIADTKEIVQNVLQGDVECGMTGAKLPHPSLQYDLFGTDEILAVGPSDVLRPGTRRLRFEQIFEMPWILREEGSGTRMAIEKMFRKKGRSLKEIHQRMEMGSTSAVKAGVKARLGLAFISKAAVQEELDQGLLSRIEVDGMDPIVREIHLVVHRGRTLSPMGVNFIRYVKRRRVR